MIANEDGKIACITNFLSWKPFKLMYKIYKFETQDKKDEITNIIWLWGSLASMTAEKCAHTSGILL